MGDIFPELRQHEVHIRETIAAEEESFGKTLLNVILNSVSTFLDFSLHFRLFVFVCLRLVLRACIEAGARLVELGQFCNVILV